ncbi:hypothetical protein MGU_10103 [Metarhizium guizhouense ARSEF 977]|uniref:Uncharacterized protein n=1 Tax=Metarhizium guizhouense (strain ARSEF 977) TaxID=1276136 RepID=A0A0B4GYK1_METGA|nr:hypothetical protein MGU_10103 [Metarhizium guizhouense ARSEF 977]
MTEQMVVKLGLATGTPDNLEDKDQGTGVVAEMTWAEQQGEGGMTEPEAKGEAMELCNAILGCELPANDSDDVLAIHADGERTK